MATTQLSDLIVPSVFAPYVIEQSLVKNALINSGVITLNPGIVAGLSGAGYTFNYPSIKHIDRAGGTPNVSSDDPTVEATAKKLAAYSQIAVRNERNDSWSSADLTAAISGTDPLAAVATYIGSYVSKWRQTSLLSVLAGVVNETRLAGSVNTIASETVSGQSASTKISAGAVVDTGAAWGDAGASGVIVMHSDTYRALQKADLITFIATSAQNLGFGSYLGFSVLVDDQAPKRAGTTDGLIYTTYLIKQGAIGYGIGSVKNPVWVSRDEQKGNGGGIETIGYRDAFCFHVDGSKWVGTPAVGNLPTDAELATAANWAIVGDTKAIGVTALVHNL